MTFQIVFEHLAMVIVALLFALIAGVPLGILSYFYPRAGKIILRVVDLIQTTPALALLGIIMVTPLGAGKPTVILGLALYSLLPIVRNVTLGLSQVSPAVKEAAKGMGMTRVYSLFHVELPLPCPCCSPACASPWSTPSARRYSPPRWAAAAWATSSIPASAATTWP
mgnify:CR=1 FL=1